MNARSERARLGRTGKTSEIDGPERRIRATAEDGSCELCDVERRLEITAGAALLLLLGLAGWMARQGWRRARGKGAGATTEGVPAPPSAAAATLRAPLLVDGSR